MGASADEPQQLFEQSQALHREGRLTEAVDVYDRLLALRPDLAEIHVNRGTALSALKRHDEALASFEQATRLTPDLAEAFNNQGNALRELLRPDDAIARYAQALSVRPDYFNALQNRVIALRDLDRVDEALADCDRMIALRPDHAQTHNERGDLLHELRRYDHALASYDRAIALQPDYADAIWNRSLLYLTLGRFEQGWPGYEWRWKKSGIRPTERHFSKPLWTGAEDVNGKTVLLHAEQGYGDTIQFCRYAKLVSARGARVILEVQDALAGLMQTLSGGPQIVVTGAALPVHDYQCPLASLPGAFGTRLDSIPATNPYLTPDREKVAAWRQRLGVQKGPRVGLVWSGRPAHRNDRRRSLPLAQMLKGIPAGVSTYRLQTDLNAADAETLRVTDQVIDFTGDIKDFSDTAALASLMDVVISVDTSVAHLAGALGKPTWLLLSTVHDWRWLAGREDSPWYPSMRIFQQRVMHHWEPVMNRIYSALTDLRG